MIGRHPRNDDFVPGFRFLTSRWGHDPITGFGSSSRRAGFLCRVTSRDGMTFGYVDQHGTVREGRLRQMDRPDLGKDERFMGIEIAWGAPLPDAPFEEIAVLADLLMRQNWRDRPMLLLCESVDEDGAATCRVVCQKRIERQRRGRHDDEPTAGDVVGNAFLFADRVRLAPGCDLGVRGEDLGKVVRTEPAPGDLLAVVRITGTNDPVFTITHANVLRIRGGMDEEMVGRWMPVSERREGEIMASDIPLAGADEIDDERCRAIARLEPDEVVVIAVPLPNGELHNTHLSKSGIKLHEDDTVNDELWNRALDAGVHIGTGIRWYDAGDDGAEWDADFRTATRADLERHGLTLEEVADHWSEYAERDVTPQEVEAMLAPGTETTTVG